MINPNQNEIIVGVLALEILKKWGGLPNIQQDNGMFKISVRHRATDKQFVYSHLFLHSVLSEYMAWRLGVERIMEPLEMEGATPC